MKYFKVNTYGFEKYLFVAVSEEDLKHTKTSDWQEIPKEQFLKKVEG